jgi:hypothetical protein
MLSEAIRERIEALIARAQNDPDPQVAMTAKVMMTGREGRP